MNEYKDIIESKINIIWSFNIKVPNVSKNNNEVCSRVNWPINSLAIFF